MTEGLGFIPITKVLPFGVCVPSHYTATTIYRDGSTHTVMSSITDSHVNVKVTPVSGHSMSHRNTLTGKVGTLIPVLVEEV